MTVETASTTRKKVFCLSFQKSATTSLGLALEELGYDIQGYYPFRDLANKQDLTWNDVRERAMDVVKQADAFKDTPWPLLYRELDEAYPESRFILVIRDHDKWIQSVVKDFGSHPNAIHNLIYGCAYPIGHEDVWIKRYEKHTAEVQAYFADRKEDLLTLKLDEGELNWENLCAFLDLPVPNTRLPRANTHASKKTRMIGHKIMTKLGLKRD